MSYKKQDFYFNLPQELIAQYPLPNRTDSRLLMYNRQTGMREHYKFNHLPQLLEPGDLLVLNDTKVIPARFYGKKASGGKVEFLLERCCGESHFLAHAKASKALGQGSIIYHENGWKTEILSKNDALYYCQVNGRIENLLHDIGHIPLPPYITRADEKEDQLRYQTIYALNNGSIAAPTAGLHFDNTLLSALREKEINIGYMTLHVGAGTFKPVRCDDLNEHKMHSEYFKIDKPLCDLVNKTRVMKKRVIAVGTTSLRGLESAVMGNELHAFSGETNIFIYPGYQFKLCDGLITNFHLPESTLLMLVAAFIGYGQAMQLYEEAIAKRYRFFSYGDSSLLL